MHKKLKIPYYLQKIYIPVFHFELKYHRTCLVQNFHLMTKKH